MSHAPRVDLALDPGAVLSLLGGLADARGSAAFTSCAVRELKRTPRRLVARYELRTDNGRHLSIVGKWFSTDRGAIVADELSSLRELGFAGPGLAVPSLVTYLPPVRALFVEAVDGPLLRERLRADPAATASAGVWLATFHGSALSSPRSCGPTKQLKAVGRWAADEPRLQSVAAALHTGLEALSDPRRPVHYDYYHSQVVAPEDGPTTVLDLDETGMGDPSFDIAHFEAHLDLLALQWFGNPPAFADAKDSFRAGYESTSPLPEHKPALLAFAWFKLAHQLLRKRADEVECSYALAEVGRSLSAA